MSKCCQHKKQGQRDSISHSFSKCHGLSVTPCMINVSSTQGLLAVMIQRSTGHVDLAGCASVQTLPENMAWRVKIKRQGLKAKAVRSLTSAGSKLGADGSEER